MPSRWLILAVLFLARMTMSYQFQAVAGLSPLLVENYGIGIADIGLLIGLYLAPGVAVAIPGGAIAARFGDKRVVSASLILMLIGGAVMAWGPGSGWLFAGRLLAGSGGVVINIVMTKMLMDWFVGREISTAMAIFINSWPVGIALSLLTIPTLAEKGGLDLAWAAVLSVIVLGLAFFALVYRKPNEAPTADVRIRIAELPKLALLLAAIVWAVYNAAFAMVFSFGPIFLTQRGWDLPAASASTSIFIVLVAVAIPLGGILADRTGRRDTVIMASLLGYAALLPLVLIAPAWAVTPIFVVVGLVFGLAAGPIVSMPAQILKPESRAFGTGIYYTIYYALMMVAPTAAGAIAERVGSTGAAFVLGSLMLVAGMLALGGFRRAVAVRMNDLQRSEPA
ncbi:MAG: CynX/NimT family MFS transporter [Paracoccaceae bacterium]